MLKRFTFIAYFILINTLVYGQDKLYINEQLEWNTISSKTSSFGPEINCSSCVIDEDQAALPIYSNRTSLEKVGKISAKIVKASYENADAEDFSTIIDAITTNHQINTTVGYFKKKPILYYSLCPVIKDEMGNIKVLTSFELEISNNGQIQSSNFSRQSSSTNNSILNQGDFYKFKVDKEGVYKLDYNFIQNLGISAANIQMDRLRIYGNGGGMLSELAGSERQDDLLENAIEVYDANGNNSFDPEDYILFFGESPNQWYWNADENYFDHVVHLYSNFNHYFLNFDIGPGKRIANASNNPNPNYTCDSFDALEFHEEDKVNIMASGKIWLGDQMTNGGENTFNFSFPNLIEEEQVRLNVRLAATANNSDSYMPVYMDDELIENVFLAKVGTGLSDPAGTLKTITRLVDAFNDGVSVQVKYNNASGGNAKGWIDFISLNARRSLNLNTAALNQGQLVFRDQRTVVDDRISEFQISNPVANLRIWDVSSLGEVAQMNLDNNSFTRNTSTLRKFVAFDGINFRLPSPVGKIERQNLHEAIFPEMIIVSHPDLLGPSEDLAQFHRERSNMEVKIVNIFDVYNEFSSGNQDLTAIRDFVKMYYDRAMTEEDLPEYLLLMGDASYDYKNIRFSEDKNTNLIPMYQSTNPVGKDLSYCSDDYLAMLDDGEGFAVGNDINKKEFSLDLAVGRIPVVNTFQANSVINKIKRYKSPESFGPWWNNITFVSDDGNSNLHVEHAESHSELLNEQPIYNIDKFYLDAFEQVAGPNGDAYPDANKALLDRIFSGSLIVNYIGHGSENTWSKEGVLTKETIKKLENKDKLPLFITATCTFSKLDDPEIISSGEWLLINPDGGGFSVVSTVRVVGASGNKAINAKFLESTFQDYKGRKPTIGESNMLAKNGLQSNVKNFRKFVLLGDPAIGLNYPTYNIVTTNVQDETLGQEADTVKALSKITVSGKVVDQAGNLIENFNGVINPVVFDKSLTLSTLGNDLPASYDPDEDNCPYDASDRDEVSCPTEFDLQQNTIFKGNARVTNGLFDFTFIIPKDISFKFGKGKISYFANDGVQAAAGFDTTVVIGGISDLAELDDSGPKVEVYLNDESFVFGGLTEANPLLYIKLEDESGMNTVGTGIGHDMTAKLDEETGDTEKSYILNNYYTSELDDFTQGKVEYPLSELEPGLHTVKVKAWDVFNNSGEGYTEFLVAESAELALQNVLNYPNPFTDRTNFWFEHNRPGDNLNVRIQVYSLSGKVVKTIQSEVFAAESRVREIEWDGKDDFGNNIARGVYVYHILVTASDNSKVSETERLVLLK